MNNIRFNYLYRDGDNYKSWGEVVFANPEKLALSEVDAKLVNAFLPDKLFVASQISIPEEFLFKNSPITNADHCYHEFDCVEVCSENSTDTLKRSISTFLQQVDMISKQGWIAFDILERMKT